MIKRSGVAIMNQRTKNVSIAKETLDIIKQKHYTAPSGKIVNISFGIDFAIDNTKLYPDDEEIAMSEFLPENLTRTPTIEVVNETTAQAAARLLSDGKTDDLVALNFASAKNPGGGFTSGAIAQEEDLCRASTLYPCLKSKPQFYNKNILCDNCFYTDNIIYSPNVVFFRDQFNSLLENAFVLSIITSPAPCLRNLEKTDNKDFQDVLYTTIYNRAKKILQVAASQGHKIIILGAWGTGAFGNDPEMVASIFKEALKEMPYFKHVCFAVYDERQPPVVYETFKKVFAA